MNQRHAPLLAAASLLLAAQTVGCGGDGPSLDPVPPQTVAVNGTLSVPLTVSNPRAGLSFGFQGPDLPGLDRSIRISGTEAGGVFTWSPLSSHVGTHEFVFQLFDGGSEIDSQTTVITVMPSADSAPVFLRPGPGKTYDLERDPCVSFSIEIRDEDSTSVTISTRTELPEGARLDPVGDKRATFEWCPMPDQVEASERWTIGLLADDGDHPPTEHDYVIVLRTGPKEGCPGGAPMIILLNPSDGARVTSEPGFSVEVEIADDMGLRDDPLLHYSTTMPDDPSKPDVTAEGWEFVPLRPTMTGTFRGRIPALGLAEGAEQTVYYVVSATDNDDPSGTICDHRTDSDLFTFTAVGSGATAGLPRCEPCTASTQCASGVCATAAGGSRCLDSCSGGGSCSSGTCTSTTTSEGGVTDACGTVDAVCEGGSTTPCDDDDYEPNDTVSAAMSIPDNETGLQICEDDDDYYRLSASAGTEITITIDGFIHSEGDLDLQLRSSSGTILDSSAGVTNSESVSYCVPSGGDVFARVFGYLGAENHYDFSVERGTGTCCEDDTMEDDDSIATARAIVGSDFDGSICPDDDDYLSFSVANPTQVTATIVFDHDLGDLDLELYYRRPGMTATLVAASRGTTDTEEIDVAVTDPGTYVLRVFGWRDATGDYLGQLTTAIVMNCTDSNDCPSGEVCDGFDCVDASCTSVSSCPSMHGCPVAGPGMPTSSCGKTCTVNSDCRSSEACKRFPEGRFCERRGSAGNGEACTTFADCGGQRACMPYTGGYCARAGCTSNADCETGTFCVDINGTNVCALDCWASDSICRSGYDCDVRDDVESLLQFVCVPL